MDREAWGPGLSHLRLGLGVVGRPGAHGASQFHQEAERGAQAAQPRGAGCRVEASMECATGPPGGRPQT